MSQTERLRSLESEGMLWEMLWEARHQLENERRAHLESEGMLWEAHHQLEMEQRTAPWRHEEDCSSRFIACYIPGGNVLV